MPSLGQVFESTVNMIQSLTDNHKRPMHIGEVMACWTYLAFVENIISFEQVGLNMITEAALKDLYQDSLKVAQSHKKELTDFMRKEGVVLPEAPEDKPKSDPNAVPSGARFTEDELANTLNINFVIAADMCAAAASQCVRTDVGLMFFKFQADKIVLAFKAKELMLQKGWLKHPPIYYSPGLPVQ